MLTVLHSFDPGYATGYAVGVYETNRAYSLVEKCVIPGGLDGFLEWSDAGNFIDYSNPRTTQRYVIEKFVPMAGGETPDLDGVPIEGAIAAMIADRSQITWQLRSDKGKKGVMDAILKRHELWFTGGDVGWDDGRDVNDAIIHALVNLRNLNHLPTLRKYFRNEER